MWPRYISWHVDSCLTASNQERGWDRASHILSGRETTDHLLRCCVRHSSSSGETAATVCALQAYFEVRQKLRWVLHLPEYFPHDKYIKSAVPLLLWCACWPWCTAQPPTQNSSLHMINHPPAVQVQKLSRVRNHVYTATKSRRS